jgi:hypothetical protein
MTFLRTSAFLALRHHCRLVVPLPLPALWNLDLIVMHLDCCEGLMILILQERTSAAHLFQQLGPNSVDTNFRASWVARHHRQLVASLPLLLL